jgi:hypothetical protein
MRVLYFKVYNTKKLTYPRIAPKIATNNPIIIRFSFFLVNILAKFIKKFGAIKKRAPLMNPIQPKIGRIINQLLVFPVKVIKR